MPFEKADPLGPPLEEAEIAPGSGPPVIVGWKAYSTLVQNAVDILDGEPGLLERENRRNVRFGRDVSCAVLVGTYADVHDYLLLTDILLERLDLQHPGTPAHG